jgi:hypothetical protein
MARPGTRIAGGDRRHKLQTIFIGQAGIGQPVDESYRLYGFCSADLNKLPWTGG